jgi:hypothetical protein
VRYITAMSSLLSLVMLWDSDRRKETAIDLVVDRTPHRDCSQAAAAQRLRAANRSLFGYSATKAIQQRPAKLTLRLRQQC